MAKRIVFIVILVHAVVAVVFELITGLCSELFFNPLPSLFHIVIYLGIPVALYLTDYLIKKPSQKNAIITRWLLIFSIAFSFGFMVMFLPLIFVSFVGTAFFGVGSFGLSPLALFITSIIYLVAWNREFSKSEEFRIRLKPVWGFLFAVVALLIIMINPLTIAVSNKLLKSDNTSMQMLGLNLLKTFVSKEEFGRACYAYGSYYQSIIEWDADEYYYFNERSGNLAKAYYYIYGKEAGASSVSPGFFRVRWDWDADIGGDIVGRSVKNLFLSDSTIDASIKFEANNAYLEWTMQFLNENQFNEEARAVIELPPDSVVSKVSLWVNGEEREAVFGKTQKVRDAYQKIVARQRDPLLVTAVGQNLVQIQCFPVPINGTMKIRLGITTPLYMRQYFRLPVLLEKNFELKDTFRHSVWIEADTPFKVGLTGKTKNEESKEYKMQITEEELSAMNSVIAFSGEVKDTYTNDNGKSILDHRPAKLRGVKPILLIDGRRDILNQIRELNISNEMFTSVIISMPYGYRVCEENTPLSEFIKTLPTFEAVDAMNALLYAVSLGFEKNIPIIWMHGALPLSLKKDLSLEQYQRRKNKKPRIIGLQLSSGVNTLIADVNLMDNFYRVPAIGDIETSFKRAYRVSRMTADKETDTNSIFLGGRIESEMTIRSQKIENSHPYRLFVFSKVLQNWYKNLSVSDDLLAEAVLTRIVTPASGAVVLETDKDYEEADLKSSVGLKNIPTIPEPAIVVLLLTALSVLGFGVLRRNKH